MARRRKRHSSLRLAGVFVALLVLGALSWLYSVVIANPTLVAVVVIGVIGTIAAGIIWWRLREASRRRLRAKTLGELLAMTPGQFEQAVADLLHDLGYQDVRRVGAAGDLHVDVWARDQQGRRVVVQCKRYVPGQRIGSPEMQTFIGMIYRHHQAERGIYVTTSDFSEPARALAHHERIWLIDGTTLTRLITQLDRPELSDTPAAAVLPADAPTVPLPTTAATLAAARHGPSAGDLPSNVESFEAGSRQRTATRLLRPSMALATVIGLIALLAIVVLLRYTGGQSPQSGPANVSAATALPVEAPPPRPAPTAGGLSTRAVLAAKPTAAPSIPTATPTDASPAVSIRQFYADLNARDFQAAWDLLSPGYQASLDFKAWVDGYSATRSVQVTSTRVTAQDGAQATVEVSIAATDATGAGTRTTEFGGTWRMVFADGRWKLDAPAMQQVSAATTGQSPTAQAPRATTTGRGLSAALARVQQEGYTVSDVGTYAPQFALHVLIGTANGSADGYDKRAFFFLSDQYLGTDASEPSASVAVVWRDDATIALQYTLYRPADPMCCPTGGAATVRFHWSGARLEALDTIPPTTTTASSSRR